MIWLKYVVPLLLWTCCNSQNVCEEPPEVDFGETVSDQRTEYRNSDRVQYSCFPGYALEGPEWITCKGPEWTPAPKCLAPCTIIKRQLEAKNLLLSGGQRRSLIIRSNQTVEFLCREGYVLSTPSVRKCIDGHMNLPSCISARGKNCSRPPTIKNGDITTLSQKQYTSGSSVEFKCQQYYTMEGHNRSFCDNGNWTNVPDCLEPCVISLAKIERQNFSVKLGSKEDEFQTLYLPHGDSIEFNCKPGHVLATDHSLSSFEFQCTGGPTVYPECKEIICESGNIVNGYVTSLKDVYKEGDELQFECRSGYKPIDRSVAVCSENGWNARLECTEIVCLHPEVDHGRVSPHKQQYSHEETIQIQCDPEYEPERQETPQCTKDGWIPQPKCVYAACRDPPTVANADIVSGRRLVYKPDHHVQYRCHDGFEMSGSDTVTCGTKVWSKPPTCEDPERHCGPPPRIQNGDVLNPVQAHYAPGTTLQYKCQNLYLMNGASEVRCENGLWTETPTCIEACTVSEEDMALNNIQLRWTYAPKLYVESGAPVEFMCRRYYREDPSSPPFRAQCIRGKIEYPRCIYEHYG